jgi:hypothetical protein
MEIGQYDINFKDYSIAEINLCFDKNTLVEKGDTIQLIDEDVGISSYYEVTKIKYRGNECTANLKLVKMTKSTTIDLQTHGIENKTTLVKKQNKQRR